MQDITKINIYILAIVIVIVNNEELFWKSELPLARKKFHLPSYFCSCDWPSALEPSYITDIFSVTTESS